jgi:hypothetical protein
MQFPSRRTHGALGITIAALLFSASPDATRAQNTIELSKIGGYNHGGIGVGASEIVAYDSDSGRLFVVNAQDASIDILDLSDPTDPTLISTIDVSSYGAVANSAAAHDGVVAVAIENSVKQNNGVVAFFSTGGTHLATVTVGALPDMLTFTPNGDYVLVANEGEPNAAYTVDPNGTVSIIDVRDGAASVTQSDVTTLDFSAYNNATLDPSIRVFGPNATVAQDFEPEYIAVSHDSRTAWVTLQENNAIAEIDIRNATITSLAGLGFKDHSQSANALDASDRDNAINITTWPVLGMYLPDAIATFKHTDDTYLVLANEGDARAYTGYDEERRVGGLTLDTTAFPNAATLKANANMGRLRVTGSRGDTDNDGDYDVLYSFGARSFSIRADDGSLVYDSGDDLEQITAIALPSRFNSSNDANGSFDLRSDDKGPEPEGVAVGKVSGNTYAFIGLERIGGIAVFDLEDPAAPTFVQYINTRNFSGSVALGTAGDVGPEGVAFISEDDSPIDNPLLIVGNEISGTTAIFEISTETLGKRAARSAPVGAAIEAVVPNPSTGDARVEYSSTIDAHVSLSLVDEHGAIARQLHDGMLSAGHHTTSIDGATLAAGSYFVVLRIGDVTCEIRPLVIAH